MLKNDNNNIKPAKNPFEEECKDCTTNIWELIMEKTNKLEKECASNTYVWIEKFKEDNY